MKYKEISGEMGGSNWLRGKSREGQVVSISPGYDLHVVITSVHHISAPTRPSVMQGT
jgi:hypothetical protein